MKKNLQNRREFLESAAISITAATLPGCAKELQCFGGRDGKPNLLFLMTDQQRFDALSYAGNKILNTPNMDRLAREGAWFENTYTQCAVCTPARASMLTGHTVANTRIISNKQAYVPEGTGVMPMKTYDEILAENGYECEYYGKWHTPIFRGRIYNNAVTAAGIRKTELGLGKMVPGLVGNVSGDIQFPDTTGDHLWSTPANWATGALPTLNDGYVRLFTLPGPIIMAGESYIVEGIHLGNTGEVAGALTLQGGTLEVLGALNCGFKGPGTININDGTLQIPGILKIARDPGSVGHINLNGGTITANNFLMREKEGSVGTMDVRGGVLTINGDQISLVQGYIDNGWITSYGGNGTPQLDHNVTNPDLTTLTAVHKLNPNPANRAIVTPGEVELSWTLPDPCVPGQPVSVDVYFTDDYDALWNFTDPEAIKVASKQNAASVVVQTQIKTRYFWAVDTYIGSDNDPIIGPIFSFVADNAPPFVNAGQDISTFLQDGTRTGPVSGIVTDDGAIQPYTVMWSVIEQPSDADPALPSAVVADPSALQTTVTVSAEGVYVLQLEANDGEYSSSDTMTINVHPDDWTNGASGQ